MPHLRLFILFFVLLCFNKVRPPDTEKVRSSVLPSSGSFPKWLQELGMGQSKAWSQGYHPDPTHGWQGPKHSGSLPLLSQEYQWGVGSKAKQLGLEPAL